MKSKPKLNQGLDPKDFEICVPEDCNCLLDDYRGTCRGGCRGKRTGGSGECTCAWDAYLADLGAPPDPTCPVDCCCVPNDNRRVGYRLRGQDAIEHARRVHQRIYRYVLRFEFVTAVDLGFAVKESEETFLPALAIRIHVGTKQSVETLKGRGIPDLVSTLWAMESGAGLTKGGPKQAFANPWSGLRAAAESLSVVQLARGVGPPALAGEKPCTPCCCCDTCARCCQEPCEKCCRCCYCCNCTKSKDQPRDCRRKKGGRPECDRCRLAICGVPLDVIEANYFPAGVHPGGDFADGVFVDKMEATRELSNEENLLIGRGRVSPLVGGISVGSDNGLAGTLGAIVWDETDGSPCVLGNWHVLAGRGARTGQPCYQPAIFDGGDDGDVIGRLKRWHFGELGDAAIAELDGSRYFASGEILGLWHPISGYRPPELSLTVGKWGRTTGFSEGFIDGIHLATALRYYDDETVRHFERQFHVAPLYRGDKVSQVGDSGSIVVHRVDLDEIEKECDERCDKKLNAQAKELEDLRLVARQLLRKTPRELVTELKKLVGRRGAKDLDDLIARVRILLDRFPEPVKPANKVQDGRSDFAKALAACEGEDGKEDLLRTFTDLLCCVLEEHGIEVEEFLSKKTAKEHREVRRVYFAVGMIFAGETPGSPFGEFALASDLGLLAKDMRFSLRPVFEPRSSFRRLRSRPPRGGRGGAGPRGRAFEPGDPGSDPRGGGPQPDGASYQSGGGNTGGG